jgi:hypothetical protein
MLTTLMNRLTRAAVAPSNDDTDLLAQFRGENPDTVRQQLTELEARRDADTARWEALDLSRNQQAARERRTIEDREPDLGARIRVLRSRVEVAEAKRRAFLELTQLLDETDETIGTLAGEMYERVLVADESERRDRMAAIDAQVRLRSRIAAVLVPLAPSVRRFRRGAPDPFGNLRQDLLARVQELDRYHAPGMPRTPIQWPAGAQELLAALNEGR